VRADCQGPLRWSLSHEVFLWEEGLLRPCWTSWDVGQRKISSRTRGRLSRKVGLGGYSAGGEDW